MFNLLCSFVKYLLYAGAMIKDVMHCLKIKAFLNFSVWADNQVYHHYSYHG